MVFTSRSQVYFNKARLLSAKSARSLQDAPIDRETHTQLQRQKRALEIAASIDIYTNNDIVVEELS